MMLEEVYELLEAIDQKDDHALQEELGDVLLHLIFHAQLAKERRAFDFRQVAKRLAEKLISRHPHVFGKERLVTTQQVLQRWHQLKEAEKPSRQSSLDGIPLHLPSLLLAQNLQKRAARVGFDWPDPKKGIPKKLREELREISETKGRGAAFARELGDLLHDGSDGCVSLGRRGDRDLPASVSDRVDNHITAVTAEVGGHPKAQRPRTDQPDERDGHDP